MVKTTSIPRCTNNSITQNTSTFESRIDSSYKRPLTVDLNQAATLLSSTYSSLEKDRAIGHMGVPYVKASRMATYSPADLDEWLESKRVLLNGKAGGAK